MADYISREAAIQFFNDWVDDLDKQINDSLNYPHLRSDYKVCKTQLLDCIHAIEEIPAADVRPVVRGEWIVDPIASNIFSCSVCGQDAPVEPTGGTEYKANFCPNCGADMRTREDDKTGIRKEQGPDGPI